MSEPVQDSEHDLADDGRTRLEAAHRDLEAAVAAYERLVTGPAGTSVAGPILGAGEMREAQEAIERAEDHLWQLREELLGWSRPSWAPNASLTSDWFSAEDSVYDDLPEITVS